MNWNQLEGKWKQLKGNAKQHWGKLTDDDLTAINGNRERLIGKLQERYGYAKERAAKEVDSFVKTLKQQPREDVNARNWYVVDSRGFREIDAARTPTNELREIYKEARHG